MNHKKELLRSLWVGFRADDINPALPKGPETMGIMVDSLLWVMQDLKHHPCSRGLHICFLLVKIP